MALRVVAQQAGRVGLANRVLRTYVTVFQAQHQGGGLARALLAGEGEGLTRSIAGLCLRRSPASAHRADPGSGISCWYIFQSFIARRPGLPPRSERDTDLAPARLHEVYVAATRTSLVIRGVGVQVRDCDAGAVWAVGIIGIIGTAGIGDSGGLRVIDDVLDVGWIGASGPPPRRTAGTGQPRFS